MQDTLLSSTVFFFVFYFMVLRIRSHHFKYTEDSRSQQIDKWPIRDQNLQTELQKKILCFSVLHVILNGLDVGVQSNMKYI